MNRRNVLAAGALVVLLSAMALDGCGSSSGGAVSLPKIAAARVFTLAGFAPSKPVQVGHRSPCPSRFSCRAASP